MRACFNGPRTGCPAQPREACSRRLRDTNPVKCMQAKPAEGCRSLPVNSTQAMCSDSYGAELHAGTKPCTPPACLAVPHRLEWVCSTVPDSSAGIRICAPASPEEVSLLQGAVRLTYLSVDRLSQNSPQQSAHL